MQSVNKVILIGNLGGAPEVRYFPDGGAVANVSLATNERWTDKNGEKQEKTQWHRLVFRNKYAEVAGDHCKKGDAIYVEGKIAYRTYKDKDGNEQNATDIVVDTFRFMTAKKDDDASAPAPAAKDAPKGRKRTKLSDVEDGAGGAI